jgi:hypothetical protein
MIIDRYDNRFKVSENEFGFKYVVRLYVKHENQYEYGGITKGFRSYENVMNFINNFHGEFDIESKLDEYLKERGII